jgi:hypothetical protein
MAITTEVKVDKIEIVGDFKHIQVRVAKIVNDGGVEIARSHSRYVVSPGDDYLELPADVQTACVAYHTPEVIAAYQEHVSSQMD